MSIHNNEQRVLKYFNSFESRLWYRLLKGTKHFGYYPQGRENISMSKAQRLMEDELAKNLDLSSNSHILDAGCGEGNVSIYLSNKYKYYISGVDISPESIKNAQQKLLSNSSEGRVDFRTMDYTKLTFDNGFFDGIYTLETLVHSPDFNKTLMTFYDVLKPGGRIVLFEYSISPLKYLTNYQRRAANLVIKGSAMPALPYFTHGKFESILKRSGFINVSVENITDRVLPMLKKFYSLSYLPYQVVKLLGLQRKFVNMAAIVESYKPILENDFWRYNIITAEKPAISK